MVRDAGAFPQAPCTLQLQCSRALRDPRLTGSPGIVGDTSCPSFRVALSMRMCSRQRGEAFKSEDLIFTRTEKTVPPNFFPEILIPPGVASSQAPTAGETRDLVVADVLSSDLTQGCAPPHPQHQQGFGEQSSDFVGLRPFCPGGSRSHCTHDCGQENKYFC